MQELFRKFAEHASKAAGSPWAFSIAILLVLVWGISGPIFGFSDTWQLIINTGTTIVTFMMVFLIQSAQNRDSLSLQLKLDELLCAVKGAREGMIDLDQLSEEDLDRLLRQFQDKAHSDGNSSSKTNVANGEALISNSPTSGPKDAE